MAHLCFGMVGQSKSPYPYPALGLWRNHLLGMGCCAVPASTTWQTPLHYMRYVAGTKGVPGLGNPRAGALGPYGPGPEIFVEVPQEPMQWAKDGISGGG